MFHCLYGRSEAVTHGTITFTPLKRGFVYMSLGSGHMGQIQKPHRQLQRYTPKSYKYAYIHIHGCT